MPPRLRLNAFLLASCLLVTACGSTTTTDPACPVTIPTEGDFTPPAPYPAAYPTEGISWYGTAELWTVLDLDGEYRQRKSVWWSENFPGGDLEERPDFHVIYRRLDDPDRPPLDNHGDATNAFTAEDGWFMIAEIDPDEPGCWQVEASYKGASLSYVYLQP